MRPCLDTEPSAELPATHIISTCMISFCNKLQATWSFKFYLAKNLTYSYIVKLGAQEILILQNQLSYLQDEDSYKKLFYHFYPVLLSFCTAILNNKEDAEEVVSEVMLRVWTMGSALNHVDNLTVYLFTAARNKAYDVLRKKKRETSTVAITENIQEYMVDKNSPESLYASNELEQYLSKTIRALPTQSQLVYRLIREQGLAYKQVTEVLGISLNTAETHMRLALKKIRTALNAYFSEEK
jgi:RNA polymerase sigma-70 factor (ECF subfamily)